MEAGVPAAEAARVLAGRLGCSERQARRYVSQAAASGRVPVPEEGTVFTVRLPVRLAAAAREHARASGRTVSGRRAGAGGVPRPRSREPSAQVREPRVETEHVFSRHAAAEMSVAYGILVPQRRARTAAGAPEGGDRDGSSDLRAGLQRPAGEGRDDRLPAGGPARARRDQRADVPEEWVFADEGHSGATLARPGLEALRDLAAQGCLDVLLVYSPDRLARKFAYQALLIEELARCGTRVEFVKGPRGDSPEDQLLVQFQGMFAEYEKAQLAERYRRGKAWRAKSGSVNVLSGAPFGYRYVRKTPETGARYEVVPHEAALVAEMFRRYADDGAAIAGLGRWLTAQGVRTRTGKERWDRSVIWGMLRNPAYCGKAVFGKTQAVHEPAGLNRTARLARRTVPRQVRVQDRPEEEWTRIPVPALVDEETFDRVRQRLEDNKRFASRNAKVPSLLQGLAACASCGYGYYRTSTTTTARKKIYYYRCLGSDDYRYEGGRVCGNKPVRADYADQVVWDHVTALLAAPPSSAPRSAGGSNGPRTLDPVTRKRGQLGQALAKTAASITAMITAFSEQLLTIDELRARMPGLRARETGLKDQIAALDAQAADRDAYLKLADDLEGFLARLRRNSATATTENRQRVLRALVQDILIGPGKITIRHRIPARHPAGGGSGSHDTTDTEGDMRESSQLRWGRDRSAARGLLPPLEPRHAVHVRARGRLHRTAHPGQPAGRRLRTEPRGQGSDRRRLPGRRGHRLAVPVLY